MTTENSTQPQDTSRDADSVYAADFSRREPENVTGKREFKFQTIFKRSVLNEIHEHGKSSPEAEICGVLVGNVHHDRCGAYLLIHASIRGDSAVNRAAQVTFKAETWTHIQSIMERDHTDAKIVGWYHTHPGFGIFLSGMDLFIQDNFFNLPWQVAFVYDPSSGDEGVFVWRNGKSEREPFLVQEEMGVEVPAAPPAPAEPPPKDEYAAPKIWMVALVAFVISFAAAAVLMSKPWETGPAPTTAPIRR